MLALRLGRGMPKEGSPSSMYSSTSEKRGRTRKPKALCSSMFCLLARGQLLRGSEHLPPLRAGPPELGDSAVDRLRHPAHGVGVLLALPFQLPVLEPFVERSGVKHLGSSCFTFGDGSTCVERHRGPGLFFASWPSFSAAGFLDWTRHSSWADLCGSLYVDGLGGELHFPALALWWSYGLTSLWAGSNALYVRSSWCTCAEMGS